jgi:hypothetical protein
MPTKVWALFSAWERPDRGISFSRTQLNYRRRQLPLVKRNPSSQPNAPSRFGRSFPPGSAQTRAFSLIRQVAVACRPFVFLPITVSQKDAPQAWVDFPPNLPRPGRPCEDARCGTRDSGRHWAVVRARLKCLHAPVVLSLRPASRILHPPHETHHRHHPAEQA